jgi:tRNA/tmRNA/rRNA uracil-C5-methylase (TrmA/RlmC/RlmD family)
VNKVASYGVPEILYVSCNPKTLAADLADFRQHGYQPVYMKAFDNFCWTKHVECVALMTKE